MARKKNKASVSKTKGGHDYRVRGPKGKIRGEYETRKKAEKKESKIEKGKKRKR